MVGVALAASPLVACDSQKTAKFAEVKPGDMPEGEAWPGVYFNEVYGYLHIVEQDGAVSGRWKRKDGSHWGELSGTAQGNVLHFTWKEHRYGAVGPSGDSRGSGMFVFKMPDTKIPELTGQYALDDSDQVGQWNCVKQMNLKPDPNSINGDNPADTPATQDKWK